MSSLYLDMTVPKRACEQRGRYVRKALHDGLVGLTSLHDAGLLHQVGARATHHRCLTVVPPTTSV